VLLKKKRKNFIAIFLLFSFAEIAGNRAWQANKNCLQFKWNCRKKWKRSKILAQLCQLCVTISAKWPKCVSYCHAFINTWLSCVLKSRGREQISVPIKRKFRHWWHKQSMSHPRAVQRNIYLHIFRRKDGN